MKMRYCVTVKVKDNEKQCHTETTQTEFYFLAQDIARMLTKKENSVAVMLIDTLLETRTFYKKEA